MKSLIRMLCLLVLCTTAGQARAGVISYFADASYVDMTNEGIQLRNQVTGLGHTAISFTGTNDSSWSTALSAANVLVIPELENDDVVGALSATTRANVASFVSNGGNLIIAGDGLSNDVNFLNTIFGYSLANNFSAPSSFALNAPAATGTLFAGGPATLPNLNGTFLVSSSLPVGARNLYSSGAGSAVFQTTYGSGHVTYLGYDWFSGQSAAWGNVLNSAINTSSVSTVPEPASIAIWGIGALGCCFVARRKKIKA